MDVSVAAILPQIQFSLRLRKGLLLWYSLQSGPWGYPPDFHWIQAHQHEHGAPTALTLGDVQVVRLMDRLDGSWFARLDCHLSMDAPLALRDCTSFERGRRRRGMGQAT